jgi:hypothetical protein
VKTIFKISSLEQTKKRFYSVERKLNKLQRVIGYCLRFINNCRNKNQRVNGSLTCLELIQAHNRIIAYVQKREFAEEIHVLSHESNNKKLNKNSRLLSLNPFIDSNDNLLRVGGRIGNSNFSYDKKHQILLPSKHYITRLLIKLLSNTTSNSCTADNS